MATAFSPAPQPTSRTRLPLRLPHRRRSASVGRSGPNWIVLLRLAAPRRAAMRSQACVLVTEGILTRLGVGSELLDHPVRFVVVVLDRRRLHEIRRRTEQGATDAAV